MNFTLALALGFLALATTMFATAQHIHPLRQPAAIWWGK